jgi:hypothetical protein
MTYTIGLDTDGDGTIDHDLTPDVLAVSWRLGMRAPYDAVAAPTRGEITLHNADGAYGPERGTIPLHPGVNVIIQANGGETLLRAAIAHVEPESGDLGGRTCAVHLAGPEDRLQAARVLIPLLVNVRASAVLDALLDQPGLSGFSRLFDTGRSVFAYVGDTWADGVQALRAVRQVVEAERGRFFTDRQGRLVFYERGRLDTGQPVQALFANDFDALDYVYGDDLVNQVRVTVRPRAVGAAGSVLWQLESAVRIAPGECRQIRAALRDSAGNPMAGRDLIDPLAVTDYQANSAADGTGTDLTTLVTLALVSGAVGGSSVLLEACNTSSQTAYLLPGARLRGTPLYQADAMLVEALDDTSIDTYGVHALAFNLPYLVTVDEAEALAHYHLDRRKQPTGRVVTLNPNPHRRADVLPLTLFDRITVIESHTDHARDYFIIEEAHTIDHGGVRHRVTWRLEPANRGGFWQVGRGQLGSSTRLVTL